jgi:hypothetical protein
MYEIATLWWTDYAPRVYEIHPKLFAEMFGYIFAATTQIQNLHPTLIRSLVVSNNEAHAGRSDLSCTTRVHTDCFCLVCSCSLVANRSVVDCKDNYGNVTTATTKAKKMEWYDTFENYKAVLLLEKGKPTITKTYQYRSKRQETRTVCPAASSNDRQTLVRDSFYFICATASPKDQRDSLDILY